jgi:hypothetical protein
MKDSYADTPVGFSWAGVLFFQQSKHKERNTFVRAIVNKKYEQRGSRHWSMHGLTKIQWVENHQKLPHHHPRSSSVAGVGNQRKKKNQPQQLLRMNSSPNLSVVAQRNQKKNIKSEVGWRRRMD